MSQTFEKKKPLGITLHYHLRAYIHYFPTSKLLILSSATLELALICLTALFPLMHFLGCPLSRSIRFCPLRFPPRSCLA